MPQRRSIRMLSMLGVLALAAGLVACTTSTPTTGSTGAPPSTEKRGPTGTVPSSLDAFYGQTLSWGPCRDYATTQQDQQLYNNAKLDCARVKVPLDYGKPQGKTITIGVLRAKATDPSHRIGSLLMNPGGPGGSGMEAAASLLGNYDKTDLAKRFDLIGFDPRGIGASDPHITCLTDAEHDQLRTEDLDVDTSPSGVAKEEAQQRQFAKQCAQRTPDGTTMLENVGSRDVAKDMDVLRSVLGDKKLSYIGFSYGTRIGSTYAEEFPKNVRAMVLDGAVDPNQSQLDSDVQQSKGFQTAFDQFVAWCVKRQDCALGNNASAATRNFRDLILPLIQRPVEVGDGRKLTFDDATTGVIQALYSAEYWQYLNSGLTELKQQTGRTLMILADAYFERDSSGKYSTTQDAFTAIHCVDDPRITDRAQLLDAARKQQQAAPFLDDGRPPAAELDACAFWPVPNTGKPHLPKVQGLPPTLVVSTTNDPATPYQAGVNLANALHGGLLTYQGTQHTASLQGNSCVDTAVANYLITLRLPQKGKRCSGQ